MKKAKPDFSYAEMDAGVSVSSPSCRAVRYHTFDHVFRVKIFFKKKSRHSEKRGQVWAVAGMWLVLVQQVR